MLHHSSMTSAPSLKRLSAGSWIATALLGLMLAVTLTACGSTDANDENPAFAVSPSELFYGEVDTEEAEEAVITISNSGDAALEGTIDVDAGSDHFSASQTGSYEVAAGSSLEVTVTFAPGEEANLDGALAITHNADAPGSPATVALSGTGIVDIADPPERP